MSCPDCTTGGLLTGEPTGVISSIQGAYFACKPSSSVTPDTEEAGTPKRAIVLLSDGFGLPLKNSKIIADNLAKRLDCDVWIPDYFEGRPLVDANTMMLPKRAGEKLTISEWIWFYISGIINIPVFISSRPSVVDARLAKFFKALEEKKYTKIGAVGYCYGGAAAVRLASTGLIQSVVTCHPGKFGDPFTIPDVKAIKIPVAWVCAEEDAFFSPALRLATEAVFAERRGKDDYVDYEFKDYKGTTHGFATRPNLEIPELKEAYEQAFEQVVGWFTKTMVV